jgi:transcription-repair coupling factor (superfamily II helicase)
VAGGRLAFVTEGELYAGVVAGPRAKPRSAATSTRWCATSPRCASAIPVVHEEHGNRPLPRACLTLDLGDGSNEFLQLVYANDAKLYVPVSNCTSSAATAVLSPDAAPLHELGSGQWEKRRRKRRSRRTTRLPNS